MLIATAGHVDHGKTLLVHALTGVDTDRLPEEKQRGLTIDLGFAYLPVDGGGVLGFVDVPGHERFIRNMIAGVPAIDFALLVVAADDGPMPQTAEHLAILDLLGVCRGAVVVTKIDRVDAARAGAVSAAAADLLAGTTLAGAPVFPVSALTGAGMDALRAHLVAAGREDGHRGETGGLRFAVDRSFSVHGAGLVVTGAVYAGAVRVGDRARLAGRDLEVRVRGLESAGHAVDEARAGMRCAVNLAGRGVDVRSVARGEWLLGPDAGPPSDRVDVCLKVLATEARPVKQWTPVHVHHGAAFVTGRVTLPAGEPVAPGAEGLAQIVTDRPLCAVHGDRIVLRDTTGRRTLGGAVVIDPYAPRRARRRAERLALLQALRAHGVRKALEGALPVASEGIDPERFAWSRNLSRDAVASVAADCGALEVATPGGPRLVPPAVYDALKSRLLASLAAHHEAEPETVGPAEEALIRDPARVHGPALARAACAALVREGAAVREGTCLRLPDHRPRLSEADAALWRRVAAHLTPATTKPLTSGDLARELNVELVALKVFLERSAKRGQLIRVARNRYFHPHAVARLARAAEDLSAARQEAGFDARSYRDATGIGRNLTIEVLEYFDTMGLTRRTGETRRVIRESAAIFGAVADTPRRDPLPREGQRAG